MAKKTYNEQLNDPAKNTRLFDLTKEMPKYVEKWGNTGIVASPLEYNEIMKQVPFGLVITTDIMKEYLARKFNVDCVCPLTCGLFVNLCANAAVERNDKEFPYWRTVKSKGELCEKFPNGINGHRKLLEKEGHKIIQKGKKYFVQDYETKIYQVLARPSISC